MPTAPLKTLRELNLNNSSTCLLRTDYNVPLSKDGRVLNDFRLRESVASINMLQSFGAKVVIMSHLGRPKGRVNPSLSLQPVMKHLSYLLDKPIAWAGRATSPQAYRTVTDLEHGQIAMLENLRFESGENANSHDFATTLAGLGNVYVNDAFGVAHRTTTSTVGVAHLLPAACGPLVEREVAVLDAAIESSFGTAVAIVGGAKLEDKLGVVKRLAKNMDKILIGGGMVAPLLATRTPRLASTLSGKEVAIAAELLAQFEAQIELPDDLVCATMFDQNSPQIPYLSDDWNQSMPILDIGVQTRVNYARIIGSADRLFWNGTMGVTEWANFAGGTMAIAKAMASSPARVKVAGGGSTVTFIEEHDLRSKFSHISTGGGAMLQYLENGYLPSLELLRK